MPLTDDDKASDETASLLCNASSQGAPEPCQLSGVVPGACEGYARNGQGCPGVYGVVPRVYRFFQGCTSLCEECTGATWECTRVCQEYTGMCQQCVCANSPLTAQPLQCMHPQCTRLCQEYAGLCHGVHVLTSKSSTSAVYAPSVPHSPMPNSWHALATLNTISS